MKPFTRLLPGLTLLCLFSVLYHASIVEKQESGEPIVVSCVGDSLTRGDDKDKRVSSYPTLLQQRLGKQYQVINAGTFSCYDNPSTIVEVLDSWVDTVGSAAKHAKPDIVILQWGTMINRAYSNGGKKADVWDQFRTEYITLIERIQKLQSHPAIFVCAPPPVYCPEKSCGFDVDVKLVNQDLPTVLSEIAHRTGSMFVDQYETLGGNRLGRPDAFFPSDKLEKTEWKKQTKPPYDGIHPNVIGNNLLADMVAMQLQEHLQLVRETYQTYEHHLVPVNINTTAEIISRTKDIRTSITKSEFYKRVSRNGTIWGLGSGTPGIHFARPVIACVGDSITEGVGSRSGLSGDTDTMSYPAILQRMPGFHHFQILNFGLHGMRVSKSPPDKSYWNTPQHKLALTSHPHMVILQFGSNDVSIPEEWDEPSFLSDYVEMIHAFQRLPSKPNVYICIPPPLYESDEGCDDTESIYHLRRCWFKYMLNTQLPLMLREIVHNDSSLQIIDNFAALGGEKLTRPDTINDDHLHPNDLGYLAMAHEIAYTLSQYENFAPIRIVKKRVGGTSLQLTPL